MNDVIKQVSFLEEKIKSIMIPARFDHSKRVAQTAVKLAQKYGIDTKKVELASLFHDCARDLPREELLKKAKKFGIVIGVIEKIKPDLLHGPVGSYIAKEEYNIGDEDICSAIYYHTTGKENMSRLEKVIYLADYMEPNRSFESVEAIRLMAFISLDSSLLYALDNSIIHLLKRGLPIHPRTVKARNWLIKKGISYKEAGS